VIWNNMMPDGTPNYDTLHEGMRVLEGTKYIVTKWFRDAAPEAWIKDYRIQTYIAGARTRSRAMPTERVSTIQPFSAAPCRPTQPEMSSVLNIHRSILGQPWRWRGLAADARDPGFAPDDLVTQLLMTRGVAREDLEQHRNPSIRAFMPDPSIFRDMDKAAERLADAVQAREQVAIFGDYDVDGATSAALLILLLRDLGLEARPYIPDRLMEGYGPSGEALVRLKQEGAGLIVTVDCGAQAFEALEMARAADADVIVVDHHKCASELPVALALVNPNRLDELRRRRARPSRRGRRRLPARRRADPHAARPRLFRGPARAAPARPARPGRARHRRRRRLAQGAQPRLRRAGPQGDGPAPQHRPERADRGLAPHPRADLHRSRLRARAADQRRRPRRPLGSRRPPAHHARSRRGARHRRRSSTSSTRNAARSRPTSSGRPRSSASAKAIAPWP
jgi:hypothetical protein